MSALEESGLKKAERRALERRRKPPSERHDILSVRIDDDASLQSAYMPFVTGGGLFIPAEGEFNLGDELFVMLELSEIKEPLPIAGKVIWVTPENANREWMRGIGLQFSHEDKVVKDLIESRLALGDFVENPSVAI
ncbi:MAG: PilZ domain-containing protein [Gammaproteobacteria bacterium]|nr:PilZ domain-containing protein [Gammaproteobacteria bacterium]MCY4198206.1 PilZ domain-containing protein [Gammaproteobacteria bacterium]MCY4277328.1 PilZ domain-containing protein [Gammaproteobacteria bacterium]MCY4323566.1 PilZ domain-containing protein [Gammaproteobacteria bacterium]